MAYTYTIADPSYAAVGAVNGVRVTQSGAGIFQGANYADAGNISSNGASARLYVSGQSGSVVSFVVKPGGVAASLEPGLHEFYVKADVYRDTLLTPNTAVGGLFYVDAAQGGHNATLGAYNAAANTFTVTLAAAATDVAYGTGSFTLAGNGFTTVATLTSQSVAGGVDTLTYVLAARPTVAGTYNVYATGYDVATDGLASTASLAVTLPAPVFTPPAPAAAAITLPTYNAVATGVNVVTPSGPTVHALAAHNAIGGVSGGLGQGLGSVAGGYGSVASQADQKNAEAESDKDVAEAKAEAAAAQADLRNDIMQNLNGLVGEIKGFIKDLITAKLQIYNSINHAAPAETGVTSLAAPADLAAAPVATTHAAAAPAAPAGALTTVQLTDVDQLASSLAIAVQVQRGQLSFADGQTAIFHLVDGTTSAAEISYAFFTGRTPTGAGLDYLLNTDGSGLKSDAYAAMSTENRYINLAVGLGSGAGAGAVGFQAAYGALTLQQATSKAYAAVFGYAPAADKVDAILNAAVPDGRGGTETRAQYFLQLAGGSALGQKAAVAGFLLADSVKEGFGVYQQADLHFLQDLAHGTPVYNVDLLAAYGPPPALVGAPAPSSSGG